jgi:endonuclease III
VHRPALSNDTRAGSAGAVICDTGRGVTRGGAETVTRAEKAARIRRILDRLHPMPPIPLQHRDPYTLLIAVLLSAQTTDARVNLVTPRLFRRARTPARMILLTVREIQELIRTCGLAPSKARAIHALSKILVERHGGRVPESFEALEALPGVGHKTASVVMSQAFGRPAFPVDTHIHRLAARWGLSDGSRVERTEADLKAVFPEEAWNRLHLQMIYFGRAHCPAQRHDLAACPICSWAASRKRIREERARWRPGQRGVPRGSVEASAAMKSGGTAAPSSRARARWRRASSSSPSRK